VTDGRDIIHQIEYRWHDRLGLSPVASTMSPDSLRAWDSWIRLWVRHPHADKLWESVCYLVQPNGRAALAWRYEDWQVAEREDGMRGRPLVSRVLVGMENLLTPEVAIVLCRTGLPATAGPRPGQVMAGNDLPVIGSAELGALVRERAASLDKEAAEQEGLRQVVAGALSKPGTPLAIQIRDPHILKAPEESLQCRLLWGLRRIVWPVLGTTGRGWSFSTFELPLGDVDPATLPDILFRQAQDAPGAAPARPRPEVKIRPLDPAALTDNTEMAAWLVDEYRELGGDELKRLIGGWSSGEHSQQPHLYRIYDELRARRSPVVMSDPAPYVDLSRASAPESAAVPQPAPTGSRKAELLAADGPAPAEPMGAGPVGPAPVEPVRAAPAESVASAPTELMRAVPPEQVRAAPTELMTAAPTEQVESAPTELMRAVPPEPTGSRPAESMGTGQAEQVGSAPPELVRVASPEPTDSVPAGSRHPGNEADASQQMVAPVAGTGGAAQAGSTGEQDRYSMWPGQADTAAPEHRGESPHPGTAARPSQQGITSQPPTEHPEMPAHPPLMWAQPGDDSLRLVPKEGKAPPLRKRGRDQQAPADRAPQPPPPAPQPATVGELLKMLPTVADDREFWSILREILSRDVPPETDRRRARREMSKPEWYAQLEQAGRVLDINTLSQLFQKIIIPDLSDDLVVTMITGWAEDKQPAVVGGLLAAARESADDTGQLVMQILQPGLAYRWMADNGIETLWIPRPAPQPGSESGRGRFSFWKKN
jgi:hypothetical protein